MADDLIRDAQQYFAVTGEYPVIRADDDPQWAAFVAWCQVLGINWMDATWDSSVDYVALLLSEQEG